MTQLETLAQKLLTIRELSARYSSRYQLERAIARGCYSRVTRGAYMHRRDWEELTGEQGYLARVLALALQNQGIIFSHETAALLHGLPLASIPPSVHIYSPYRTRVRDFTVHHGELHLPTDSTVFSPGIRATSLARTLDDMVVEASEPRRTLVRL
ncbi:hypothetical protein ACN082_06375 [Rothia sp. CCM 9417]|uniref:hypothetical protein n=1 Tax=Rothia sp. CCM 9417 TaxID=3402657 RepID=UPI003AE867E5